MLGASRCRGVCVCGVRPAEGRARREPEHGDATASTRATENYRLRRITGSTTKTWIGRTLGVRKRKRDRWEREVR